MIDFQELVQNVLDGSEDPLRAYAELKQYEKLIKSCLTEIWDIVDTEAAKEDKNFERYGFKFENVPEVRCLILSILIDGLRLKAT